MARRSGRRDATHAAIVKALRAAGCVVLDVADVRNLGCDLVVFAPSGAAWVLEAKDGDRAPSHRKLTDSEIKLAFQLPKHFRVVGSVAEALRLVAGEERVD